MPAEPADILSELRALRADLSIHRSEINTRFDALEVSIGNLHVWFSPMINQLLAMTQEQRRTQRATQEIDTRLAKLEALFAKSNALMSKSG